MSPIWQLFLHSIRFSQVFSRKRVLRTESLEQRTLLDAAPLYSLSSMTTDVYDSDLTTKIAAEATELSNAELSNLASQSFSLLTNAEGSSINGSLVSMVGDYYTIDFALAGTQRVYLTGLTASQVIDLAEGMSSFQTDVFYDAEKTDVGDTNLCWAATCSNMLRYTGWGVVDGLETEDDILAYFTSRFTDDGSTIEAGNEWFLTGVYAPANEGFDDDNDDDSARLTQAGGAFWPGAHWSDVSGVQNAYKTNMITGEDGKTHEQLEFSFDMEVVTTLTGHLQTGDAVGLGLYWMNPTTMESEGGHAVTLWGYAYDTAYTIYDSEYYTMLFVSDSDDANPAAGGAGGAAAPDQLQTYGISWDAKEESYYFTTYGAEDGIAGYLAMGTWLEPQSTAVLTPSGGIKIPRGGYSVRENARDNAFIGKLRPVNAVSKDDVYTYEITAGSDHFCVDDRGILRVKKDADIDYEKFSSVQVTVLTSLNGKLKYADTFAVAVRDQNENPAHIGFLVDEESDETDSDESDSKVVTEIEVAERETTIGQLTAYDPEGTVCTFRVSGVDAKLFAVAEKDGKYFLQTKTILSSERPQDKNHDGIYELFITATDATGKSSKQKVRVTVTHQEVTNILSLDMPSGQNNQWTVEVNESQLTVKSGTKVLVDEALSHLDFDTIPFSLQIHGQDGDDTLIWKCESDPQESVVFPKFHIIFAGGTGTNTIHVDGANTGNLQTISDTGVQVGRTALNFLLSENVDLLSQLYLDGGTGDDRYDLRGLACAAVIRDRGGSDTIDLTHATQGVTLNLNDRLPQPMFNTTLTLRSKIETVIGPSE